MHLGNSAGRHRGRQYVLALGAIKYLINSGYRIPEDICGDRVWQHSLARCLNPPLTTVALPLAQMADMAMQLFGGKLGASGIEAAAGDLFWGSSSRRRSTKDAPMILDF